MMPSKLSGWPPGQADGHYTTMQQPRRTRHSRVSFCPPDDNTFQHTRFSCPSSQQFTRRRLSSFSGNVLRNSYYGTRPWSEHPSMPRLPEPSVQDLMMDIYAPKMEPAARWLLMAFLLLGLFFATLDTTIVSTALVRIAEDMDNFRDMYWAVLSYMLSYLGCAIGFAKLADHIGRLPVFILSWCVFIGSSIGCAESNTMAMLIVFRAVQGVGGSGLYSISQISIAELTPYRQNHIAGLLIGVTLALSFILGPLIGGAISNTNWHWIFWVNVPFGSIAVLATLCLWPRDFGKPQHPWREVWRIDFIGNIFILAACCLLVFSLQQAGTMMVAWSSMEFLLPFFVSIVCWGLFWAWELILRHVKIGIEPVFPMRLLQNRVWVSALASVLLSGYSYFAVVITLPERLQIVNFDTALLAGVHLLPMLGCTALGSIIGGGVNKKRNNTSPTLVVAAALQVIGLGLLSTFDDANSPVQPQYAYQAVFGLGVGLSFSGATVLTKIHASARDHAVAQGAIAQVRVLGGVIGLAVCTIVFNAHLDGLSDQLSPDDMDQLHRSPMATQQMSGDKQELVREVFAQSFANMLQIMLYISAVGLIASLFTWETSPTPIDKWEQVDGAVDTTGVLRPRFYEQNNTSDTAMFAVRGGLQALNSHGADVRAASRYTINSGSRHKQMSSHGSSETELDDLSSTTSAERAKSLRMLEGLDDRPVTQHRYEDHGDRPVSPACAI